jgi:hypothetical protein
VEARVVAETLGPQPRSRTDVEPVIKVLVEGLMGGADIASEVPLREHAVEVGLRGAQPAVNQFAELFAFSGFRIAANVDADHPHLRSAADDLTMLACHLAS